jgi:hypothetical protein
LADWGGAMSSRNKGDPYGVQNARSNGGTALAAARPAGGGAVNPDTKSDYDHHQPR